VVLGLGRQLRVFPTVTSETVALARHIAETARRSIRARGVFSIVLSGGHTPERLYRLLGRRYPDRIPWEAVEIFFGDERCVPPRNRESNYAMARTALLSHVPVSRARIHRLRGEVRPPSRAAAEYAGLIGPLPPSGDPTRARFDLVLLGLGPDGHTASLFPGAPALTERRRTVVAVPRSGQPPFVPRLTLTIPALGSAREVCFLVSGEEKASAVAAVLGASLEGDLQLPASLVRAAGLTTWYLDREAARELPSGAKVV
jgi:6-phosphogluconolactonase